jgi:hypothetical protein
VLLDDDDDADPARVGVVAARKAMRRPEGTVTAILDGLTLSALLAAAGAWRGEKRWGERSRRESFMAEDACAFWNMDA